MATASSLFFIACALSLLVGQVSYGHKLLGSSSNEDERASCPNTNCQGKGSCTTNSECASNQCCIDLQLSRACCYSPGNATNPPVTPPTTATLTSTASSTTSAATTTTQVAAPTPTQFPLCTDYYPNTDCGPNGCPCTAAAPYCYENEICCAGENAANLDLFCYSTIPPTPAPPPAGGICPSKTPPLKCNPDAPVGDCTAVATLCRSSEICCKFTRSGQPCCVVV